MWMSPHGYTLDSAMVSARRQDKNIARGTG